MTKLSEQTLLLMVCVQKKSTAWWLEKVVMKEFLRGLWLGGVREGFLGRVSQREVIYGDLF